MIDVRVSKGQVQVTMTIVEMKDILLDLGEARLFFDDECGLEPGSEELIERLRELGIK